MRADPRAIPAVDDAVKIFNRALYCAIGARPGVLGARLPFFTGNDVGSGHHGPRLLRYDLYLANYVHQAHGKFNAAPPPENKRQWRAASF